MLLFSFLFVILGDACVLGGRSGQGWGLGSTGRLTGRRSGVGGWELEAKVWRCPIGTWDRFGSFGGLDN